MSDQLEFPTTDFALTPAQRKAVNRKTPQAKGYADRPGSGPKGETCRSCAHLVHKRLAKTYLKCELTRACWTGGHGTDVLARSPACSKWAAIA